MIDATRRREKQNNPTLKIAANKQIIEDATRRREKQMNNPTLRIERQGVISANRERTSNRMGDAGGLQVARRI